MILLFVFPITYQFYRQRIIITEYAYVQTFLIFRKSMGLKQWDVAWWITSYVKLNVIAIAREIINQCKFSNNFTELPSLLSSLNSLEVEKTLTFIPDKIERFRRFRYWSTRTGLSMAFVCSSLVRLTIKPNILFFSLFLIGFICVSIHLASPAQMSYHCDIMAVGILLFVYLG